ncbi:MFS transporter [Paraburkholderia sp. J12]|uniref:MFS transporter n=1 Tax=Paraburkholderia sp. J12 TaxID=2805432 RepID=UPI002ABDC9FC|nr:MFS transporter [Paraburkholderia sp. J12]
MNAPARLPWRSIVALNAVSLLAQLGQFGVGFAVVPQWLAQRGLGITQLGSFASVQWAGMLAGILAAPVLARGLGARLAVFGGLAASVAAFAALAAWRWPLVLAPGFLLGFGVGVRWIANETWLFRLVPEEMSGRFVGAHETLIAIAGLLGPAVALLDGARGAAALWIGAFVTALAGLPLFVASLRAPLAVAPLPLRDAESASSALPGAADIALRLGLLAAAVAGLGDGALYGLMAKFCEGNGFGSAQCALLLVCLGLGGALGQYPVGWAADRCGVLAATTACGVAGAAAAVALALAGGRFAFAVPAMLVLGVASNAFLTLACITVAAAPRAQIDRRMRAVSVVFTLGSMSGPLLAAQAMARLGANLLMWQIAFVCVTLCAYALGVRHGLSAPLGSKHRNGASARRGAAAT